MKLHLLFLFCLTLLCQFSATQSLAQRSNPFDDLLDGKREGLFAGGGVAYGLTRFTISNSKGDKPNDSDKEELAKLGGTSGQMQWKIGYATSENLAFYVTSFGTNLDPSLGVMMFSQQYPGYYLNALIGYSSFEATLPSFAEAELDGTENYSTWNFGAGVGYEFRPHFMVELTAGYSRLTIPSEYETYSLETGISYEDVNVYFNRITLFASFNYLFY